MPSRLNFVVSMGFYSENKLENLNLENLNHIY